MKHVMVDLETLGTSFNALIVAIGACEFDPSTTSIGRTFAIQIDPADALDFGLVPDISTIMWWMKQSDAARKQFEEKSYPLIHSLNAFNTFVKHDAAGEDRSETVKVWGNGATFDNVLLRSAFKAIGVKPEWSFRHDCCYRTLKHLLPNIKAEDQPQGVAHVAVDDAIYQAKHALKLFGALGGAL